MMSGVALPLTLPPKNLTLSSRAYQSEIEMVTGILAGEESLRSPLTFNYPDPFQSL